VEFVRASSAKIEGNKKGLVVIANPYKTWI
jgi:hypothetical protein